MRHRGTRIAHLACACNRHAHLLLPRMTVCAIARDRSGIGQGVVLVLSGSSEATPLADSGHQKAPVWIRGVEHPREFCVVGKFGHLLSLPLSTRSRAAHATLQVDLSFAVRKAVRSLKDEARLCARVHWEHRTARPAFDARTLTTGTEQNR